MSFHLENPLHITLQQLEENAQPKWGRMTPQHMIEHLSDQVRYSNGNALATVTQDAEKLARNKAFMLTNRPFPKNIGANPENPAPLPALRNPSLADAISELLGEVEAYKTHHQVGRGSAYAHSVFGNLNKAEWDHFHDKHFKHHLAQFGLLEDE
jgi:oxepin-CoA hydrolase/3-oxo-5,6-dehydrosuberyl-CoA semialdehyde dehydrogenase